MTAHRYSLRKYKNPADRLACPACGSKKSLVPYTDTHTGFLVDESCGKCNRAEGCAYHLPPRVFFAQHPDRKPQPSHHAKPLPREPDKRLMYLPLDTIAPCLAAKFRAKNGFWRLLAARFGNAEANAVFDAYHLGTSNHYGGGACVFPLFDGKGYASAQIIKVDAATGRTVRFTEGRATTWLHCITDCGKDYKENADKFPFCFGLHLALAEPQKAVCIVESSKSAVVCSVAFPGFIWLGVGAKDWLNPARLAALKGRTILLVPDGGKGTVDWAAKVPLLRSHGHKVDVCDFGLPAGDDIMDLIMELPPRVQDFESLPFTQAEIDALPMYPADWDSPEPLPEYPLAGYENRKLAFVFRHAQTIADFALAFDFEMGTATIRDSVRESETLPIPAYLPAHRQLSA